MQEIYMHINTILSISLIIFVKAFLQLHWLNENNVHRYTLFLRGAGGFSKPGSKLYSYENRSPSVTKIIKLPVLHSDSTNIILHEDHIHENQV